ncbi:MAG: GAF domain-containing sensor histidine kinase, partial [Marinilabiliales bacterium]|nr:GAF domain-containing sensor histidine kinase [Marinilabiliales bacterium]
MIPPSIPANEQRRIENLKSFGVLDTLPEAEYDEITFLASLLCGTPISLVSLIDEQRQWFKSHHGLDATETPREFAFCAHALNQPDQLFVIHDSRKDERFHDNPLVTGSPHVIFYAGMPLVSSEGYALGTLCVIDHKPNHLNEDQEKALKALAHQVGRLLELRKKRAEQEQLIYELSKKNEALDKFVVVAAHDIKSPLNNIIMFSELFSDDYAPMLNEEGQELLQMINRSTYRLAGLIDGILMYSRDTNLLSQTKEMVPLQPLIQELLPLLDIAREAKVTIIPEEVVTVDSNKIALERVFINLISNSLKYNLNPNPEIIFSVREEDSGCRINVADNGAGISAGEAERIFEMFETGNRIDREGKRGNGIGLATVKALVDGLGGSVRLVSLPEQGA